MKDPTTEFCLRSWQLKLVKKFQWRWNW